MKEAVQIGEVTHYYGGLGVAVVKFNRSFSAGEKVHFRGATTDFEEDIASMQFDHKEIQEVKKGQEVGIKVREKVRKGDKVFEVL